MLKNVEIGRYVTCEVSYEFYENLTTGQLKGLGDPEKIFPIYHEAYSIIFSFRENPLLAMEMLKTKLEGSCDEDERFLILKFLAAKLKNDLTGIFLLANDKIKLCISLINREADNIYPELEEKEEVEPEFNWKETKAHLNSLPNDNEKLAYLIDAIALYQQEVIANDLPSNNFDIKCKSEIERIENQQELLKMKTSYGGNIFLSKQKGSKIDFIRIVNAMYELKFFSDANGLIPSKELVMITLGKSLGIDLANYDSDLSQAFSTGKPEKNIAIFEQMSAITTKFVTERL